MARKKQTQASRNMDPYSFTWEDAFYIYDLNDGSLFYRGEQEGHWYNLCLKPNPFYNVDRHLCVACGEHLQSMLNTVRNYVSAYRNPREMHDAISNISNEWNRRLGNVMMGYAEDWWQHYSYESTKSYEDAINEYIEIGRRTRTYSGPNIKVKYTEDEEEYSIEGRWAEWFEEFVDRIMSFDGHTKQEFYELLSDDCDISIMNDIFANLKAIGIRGIGQMKKLNMYRWIDVLAPLVNEWSDYDYDDEDEDGEEE